MFDQHLFNKKLSTSWLGRELFYFQELPSTNTYAKQIVKTERFHGAIVLADNQTEGRGQHQRNWVIEAHQNLTFSIIFEPQKGDRLSILTLACALAVSEYIEEHLKQDTQLKWPNDVLVNGKKISGLLTETVFRGDVLDRLVIGIGFNINQRKFDEKLTETATSLAILDDKKHQREEVLARLLTRIEYLYRLWSTQDIDLIKRINKKLIGYGKWVTLEVNDELLDSEYKFMGINELGHLVVLNKALEVNTFSHEQVKVRLNSSKS